jgi:hypothetical protein
MANGIPSWIVDRFRKVVAGFRRISDDIRSNAFLFLQDNA